MRLYSSRLKERCPEGVYSFFVCPSVCLSVRLSVRPSVRLSVRNCHKNVRPIPNPRNMYMCVSCDRREHRIYFTFYVFVVVCATEGSTEFIFRFSFLLLCVRPKGAPNCSVSAASYVFESAATVRNERSPRLATLSPLIPECRKHGIFISFGFW